MNVNIKVLPGGKAPEYKTPGAAAADLFAHVAYDPVHDEGRVPLVRRSDEKNCEHVYVINSSSDKVCAVCQRPPTMHTPAIRVWGEGGRALVPCGFAIELPVGWEAQVRPRSGLALKSGITILNSPGTIDADYRGEVGAIVHNTNPKGLYYVLDGDRIAQLVIARAEQVQFAPVEELSSTDRGAGGFGSTGQR